MAKRVVTAPVGKQTTFDPKSYLDPKKSGRAVSSFDRDEKIFSQGSPSDAVFYIRKGKVKITVLNEQGKEAVIAILDADVSGKAALPASRADFRMRAPSRHARSCESTGRPWLS